MKVKTFKYIDKDRMVPYLMNRRGFLTELAYSTDSADKRMSILDVVDEIDRILQHIDEGLWDWQQGSE